jgi:adenylate kinase
MPARAEDAMTAELLAPAGHVSTETRTDIPIVVLFGCPGAGKGTLAGYLAERHGFAHLSTGAAMRAWAEGPTPEQRELKDAMARGDYGSDALAARIVAEAIDALDAGTPAVILDGFPRNPAQYTAWRSAGGSGLAVLLDLDEAVAVERIAGRGTCPADGAPVRRVGDPCPVCGGPTGRRTDDTEVDTVHRRFAAYRDAVLPILDAWRCDGLPLRTFDADVPIERLEGFAAEVAELVRPAAIPAG